MIRLDPIPEASFKCPYCNSQLKVSGWYMPGMRCLADLMCLACKKEYYGDLSSGHGYYYPILLEKKSGRVFGENSFFSSWLRQSYNNKNTYHIKYEIENIRNCKKAILLNCIDRLYGHSLLKLLNAQYYLDSVKDKGLIVIIQKNLRWLVPDEVSTIITLDLPMNKGNVWSDEIAIMIFKYVKDNFDECYLGVAYPEPHPSLYNIERFTKIQPFHKKYEWDYSLNSPIITFIWREDRCWTNSYSDIKCKIIKKYSKHVGTPSFEINNQYKKVIALSKILKNSIPNIKINIVGIGKTNTFPNWINDFREESIKYEHEKLWCELYSKSNIVIGVHGSNMLLPSAHAGAVIELMPNDRWGNITQDLLFGDKIDMKESLFLYRILPIDTEIKIIEKVILSILSDFIIIQKHMGMCNITHTN